MPDPSTDRIIILAQSGVTIRQAEAAIGRRMTDGERQAWDKAQVRRKLERAAKKARGPQSSAERKAAFVARRAEIGPIPPPADPERKETNNDESEEGNRGVQQTRRCGHRRHPGILPV